MEQYFSKVCDTVLTSSLALLWNPQWIFHEVPKINSKHERNIEFTIENEITDSKCFPRAIEYEKTEQASQQYNGHRQYKSFQNWYEAATGSERSFCSINLFTSKFSY